MLHPIYVNHEQINELELEVISTGLRVYLTRLIDKDLNGAGERALSIMNLVVNMSRSINELPIYVLEGDENGMYQAVDYDWNRGEFLLALRRSSTVQFVELVCDLINKELLGLEVVNIALEQEKSSIQLHYTNNKIAVQIFGIDELEEGNQDESHPNVRVLIARMRSCLDNSDYTGVLHASANIFETLAKDIVAVETIQNQTLGGFFEKYKKESKLPEEIVDKILEVYKQRNTEPLAGHGSTVAPSFSQEEATILAELTVAFVRIEYRLKVISQNTM